MNLRPFAIPAAFAATLATTQAALVADNGDVAIHISISSAPNGNGGAAYQDYLANLKLAAGPDGFSTMGDPDATPAALRHLGPLWDLRDAWVTDFPSWRGQANPTGAFAGEYGNRLQYNVLAIAKNPGVTLRLSGISMTLKSDVLPEVSDFHVKYGSYAHSVYSTRNVGVTGFGADGVLGGGDDTYLMNGESGDTDVLALILRGNGTAFDGTYPMKGKAWDADVTHDQKYALFLNDYINAFPNGVDLTPTYTIQYRGGLENIRATGPTHTVVPEPAYVGLPLAAGAALLFRRRRRES